MHLLVEEKHASVIPSFFKAWLESSRARHGIFWRHPQILRKTIMPKQITEIRAAEIAASTEIIWSFLGDLQRWPEWDPDIKSISEVQGGLTEGGTFLLHMESMSVPITFRDVRPNESARWAGSTLSGCVVCEGIFHLQQVDAQRTKFDYSFGITGCLGCLVTQMKQKEIVTGVEVGLDNIKKFSEAMGVLADCPQKGCPIREDQEERSADQVQDQVQQVPLHSDHDRQDQG
eukprot:symbB.v1.2.013566.t1/scaffold963.1/size148485/6